MNILTFIKIWRCITTPRGRIAKLKPSVHKKSTWSHVVWRRSLSCLPFCYHQRSKLQLVKPRYILLSGYISGNLGDSLTVFVYMDVYRIAEAPRCCYFTDLWSYFKPFCVMSVALFWCAYAARGTSEFLPITRAWFAVELSQCLDKMADVNGMVKQRWFD